MNGRAELIVQDAAAFEEMLDAVRGIQRGLDAVTLLSDDLITLVLQGREKTSLAPAKTLARSARSAKSIELLILRLRIFSG